MVRLPIYLFLVLLIGACQTKPESASLFFVVDEASILSAEEKQKLSDELSELEQSIGSQMAILIITSLNGETINDYSIRKATEWGLGRKDYNDGILIMMAVADQQLRIEVGTGLEPIIKDEIAARIIREDMAPEFRKENYYQGFHAAVTNMKVLIRNNKHLIGKTITP
jgi:uncharacterized protein